MDKRITPQEWERFRTRKMPPDELADFSRRLTEYGVNERVASPSSRGMLSGLIEQDFGEAFDYETLRDYVAGAVAPDLQVAIQRLRTIDPKLDEAVSLIESAKRQVEASLAMQPAIQPTSVPVRPRLFLTLGSLSFAAAAGLAIFTMFVRSGDGQKLSRVVADNRELSSALSESQASQKALDERARLASLAAEREHARAESAAADLKKANSKLRGAGAGSSVALQDGNTQIVQVGKGRYARVLPPADPVARALDGKFEMDPSIVALAQEVEPRGAIAATSLYPAVTAVESARPLMTWHRTSQDSSPMAVRLFFDGRRIWDSPETTASSVQVPDGLIVAGKTYQWSVTHDGDQASSRVTFRVLTSAEARQAQRIASDRSLGHLDRALGYLRLGVLKPALEELNKLSNSNPELSKRLQSQLKSNLQKLAKK